MKTRREIFNKLAQTMTYKAIGLKYGITAERVRQVMRAPSKKEQKEFYDELARGYLKYISKLDIKHIRLEAIRLSEFNRTKAIATQRKILVHFLFSKDIPVPEIARMLGRDKTTIRHLLK